MGRGLPARRARPRCARSPRIWRCSSIASVPRFRRGRKPSSSPGSPSWSSAVPVRTVGRGRAGRQGRCRDSVWRPDQAACPEALGAAALGLCDLRAATSSCSVCATPSWWTARRATAWASGRVVRPRGPRRVALRRRRGAGPRRSVPDHEAGREAADQRGHQGHRQVAGLLRPVRRDLCGAGGARGSRLRRVGRARRGSCRTVVWLPHGATAGAGAAVRRRGRGVPDRARRTATSSDRCWRTAPRSCGRRDRSCVSRETGHRQVRARSGPGRGGVAARDRGRRVARRRAHPRRVLAPALHEATHAPPGRVP